MGRWAAALGKWVAAWWGRLDSWGRVEVVWLSSLLCSWFCGAGGGAGVGVGVGGGALASTGELSPLRGAETSDQLLDAVAFGI